ncbi:MAG TPA: ABC transporter ATP-binding protein [Egibacteraceae bacterium]|nr:ABC transporter ATP-binding protein [Egibacteraceae bacterium]
MPNLSSVAERHAPDAGAAPRAEPVLVRGLHKRFGATPVLTGVDLDVPAGGVVALLGPSGCGKTTLLRSIAGLERPDSGEIHLGERLLSGDGTFVPAERRRIGMVFQDWALFPHLSVGRNVGFGLSREERRGGRVEEALELVGLAGLRDRAPATLSGGQQQRVALARAIANRPSVILLDEPFSNLDASLRVQVRAEVVRLLRALELTALFVTHDQEEAFLLGDQVAVMLAGVIEQQAEPAELYAHPASREVATFVGDANFLPGRADGRTAHTCVGPVALRDPADGDVDVLARPEQLVVAGDHEGAPGVPAVIEAVEYYGHDAVYVVRAQDGPSFRTRVIATPRFRGGDRVRVGYAGEPTIAYPAG